MSFSMKLKTNRNNMQENSFIKVYWIQEIFEVNATHYEQKTEIFLITRSPIW